MERKLASIQRIRKILPIKNADAIECITIHGWELVAKKGEFKEDDLCVYFEIDSFLPDEDRFTFLKDIKTHQGKKGYRLKTIKLRGQISQGLALPLTTFPEIKNPIEGQEVTELLNVIKYDNSIAESDNKPGLKSGKAEGKFPSFLRKTDQERIQNLPDWFDRYKDTIWEETLKLDGSSCTMYKIKSEFTFWDKIKKFFGVKIQTYKFGVCSRNIELKRTDNYSKTFMNDEKESQFTTSNFWRIAQKYNVEDCLPVGYGIQGELIGPNIQNNHEKVDDLDFFIFDIFNIEEQRYLNPAERKEFWLKNLIRLKHVPILGYVKIFEDCQDVQSLLKRVKGESMNKGTISEGRVYKEINSSNNGNPKSFKCINNEYLLKCEE